MANFYKLKYGDRFKFHRADNPEWVKRNGNFCTTIMNDNTLFVSEIPDSNEKVEVFTPRTVVTEVWE